MKTKFLLGCDAQFECGAAISALLAGRTALDRHVFACAAKTVAARTVICSSVAARFESIRSSHAG